MVDGGLGAGVRECGKAEAQRMVRAALRAGLHVTAAPADGVMVVTVATAAA